MVVVLARISSLMDIVMNEDVHSSLTFDGCNSMPGSDKSDAPRPLRPVVFAILLALNESALHGYAIMKAVNDRLEHRAIVGPGTLYRVLKELRDASMIATTEAPPGEDARRQYYKLTETGRIAAANEAAHMADLVAAARAGRLIPDAEPAA